MEKVKKIIASIQETNNFQQALTHSSACNEDKSLVSYETLEFLGDSILNFYTSLFIYRSFPHYSEGQMSKLRQLMVQQSTLSDLSKQIGLVEYLKLSMGEKKNHGTEKESILADIFESFVAALYLEKGGTATYRFLKLTLFAWIKGRENMIWDYKTQLQEHCQTQKIRVNYRPLEKERRFDPQRLFTRELILERRFGSKNQERGFIFQVILRETGKGKSKKEAEQEAAAKALRKLGLIDS